MSRRRVPPKLGARWDVLDSALGIETAQPQSARSKRQRESRANVIDTLTQAMEEHLRAARDHAFSLRQSGRPPALLPRPTQEELARMAGISAP